MSARTPRCKAKTKARKPCKARPVKGTRFCLAHSPDKDQISPDFQTSQPGAGRPAKPTVTALLRERALGRAEVIDEIYGRALTEPKLVAKYEGEVHVSDVEDLGAMLNAAERYLDRIEGKPRPADDMKPTPGSETGGPGTEIVGVDAGDPEIRRLAHELLARAAGRTRDRPQQPRRPRVVRRRPSKAP